MSLSEAQVQHLRDSWAKVDAKTNGDYGDTGVVMFVRLFSENPELIPIFPFASGDIEKIQTSPRVRKHGKSVMGMVATAVAGLGDLDALVVALTDLGKRHKTYKATPAHFPPVGAALLYALGQALGDEFTPDVKEAWVTVFGIITTVMSAALTS